MHRRALAATALAVTLSVGALLPYSPTGIARAAASLPSLTLKKSDVPAGYKQGSSTTQTIQQAAQSGRVSVATLRSKGWVGSYQTTFQKVSKLNSIDIESNVSQFKTAGGAGWDLSNGIRVFKAQYPNATIFSVSGVGDQAVGIKGSAKTGAATIGFVFVAFRRGRFIGLAGIANLGPVAKSAPADSERYARIMDNRLKHA